MLGLSWLGVHHREGGHALARRREAGRHLAVEVARQLGVLAEYANDQGGAEAAPVAHAALVQLLPRLPRKGRTRSRPGALALGGPHRVGHLLRRGLRPESELEALRRAARRLQGDEGRGWSHVAQPSKKGRTGGALFRKDKRNMALAKKDEKSALGRGQCGC